MMGHSKDSSEHHCVDISLVSRYLQYLLPVASGATGQLSPGAGWAEAAACGLSLSPCHYKLYFDCATFVLLSSI